MVGRERRVRVPGSGGWGLASLVATLLSCTPSVPPQPVIAPWSYHVYVGAESADSLHRLHFDGRTLRVERSTPVSRLYRGKAAADRLSDHESPHGVAAVPGDRYVYMTTGHGIPDGKLWKVEAGPDTAVAEPVDLGRFPASLAVSPDGNFVYVANFNLHGEMAPSSISVVYTPDMMEVARVTTCTMPHGSRVSPDGARHYSVCMMDDQLVEIDTRSFQVARRFSVATDDEGPLGKGDLGHHATGGHHGIRHAQSCSPTWVDTSPDGSSIYVACNRSDEVLEIDADAWEVTRRFEVGRGPYNLSVTPDGRLLVVTLKQGNAVELIDLGTAERLAVQETSTTVVHGVAISPDSRYAFVSVEGVGAEPGKVDVFDLRSFERVASAEVGLQASGITFWNQEEIR
jgi:DNA-binding beta-propeller fold protein YncE